MPAKNSLKTYVENGFYHVYNRGVEKRNIFLDDQDFQVFISYLKLYLTSAEEAIESTNQNKSLDYTDKNIKIYKINSLNNYFNKIELLSYVLMPNHFHMELKQIGKKDIEFFMRSLITKYTMYFNRKYKRVGPLFQGRYKAVLIQNDEYLLDLSNYIHTNPVEILSKYQLLTDYQWSSLPAYINNYSVKWIKKEYILENFSKNYRQQFKYYKDLLSDYLKKSTEMEKSFKNILLDSGHSLT